jgi:NhaP-type Na+/H+ or K+/H+ antiporter
MFIASFVAGLAVQIRFKDVAKHSIEFTEEWGQLVNYFVFYVFGILVYLNWSNLTYQSFIYALLSLTLVRILPVAISLTGSKIDRLTVMFMGWFGPRGLASIVLGLVFLQHEATLAGESVIRDAVMATVLLSIVLHGVTALPGMEYYSRRLGHCAKS